MSENTSAPTKKQLIDKTIIPNILSKYLRYIYLHYEEKNALRNFARQITDKIPKHEGKNNKRDNRKEHNGNDTWDH